MITGEIKLDKGVVATFTAERGTEVRPGEFIYSTTCQFVGANGQNYEYALDIEHVQIHGTLTLAARILNAAHYEYQPVVSVLP